MQRKQLSAENINDNEPIIQFWRSANAAGGDIFASPGKIIGLDGIATYPAIILVDDIRKTTVAEMRRQGYEPCAVVETSPGNFQAWICFSRRRFAHRQLLPICRFLANKFDGDIGAAHPGQFGRIPGFTNRKPEHRLLRPNWTYQYPFCRLYYACDPRNNSEQNQCTRADNLINMIRDEDKNHAMRFSPRSDCFAAARPALNAPPRNCAADRDAQIAFDREIRALKHQYAAGYDYSRGDWMTITNLLRKNHPPLSVLKAVFFSAESNLTARKTNPSYYLRRTFEKAFAVVASERGDDKLVLGDECRFFLDELESNQPLKTALG